MNLLEHSLYAAALMLWETFWALVLGFGISAAIQTLIRRGLYPMARKPLPSMMGTVTAKGTIPRFIKGNDQPRRLHEHEYNFLLRDLVEKAMGRIRLRHNRRTRHLRGHLSLALRCGLLALPFSPRMSTFAPFHEPRSRWWAWLLRRTGRDQI